MAKLIDDYIAFNPTRNRDLDLLPLLAFIDEAEVRRQLPDEKINPRPTFHYRLPDMQLGDPDWGLASEWNRWVLVERLAEDGERLAALCRDYLDHRGDRDEWADAPGRSGSRMKPRIGVTSSRRGGWRSLMLNRLALMRAGAKAVGFRAGDALTARRAVRPDHRRRRRYRRRALRRRADTRHRIDPARDEMELTLLEKASAVKMPILGICRGAQIMNVQLGGTLHADIHEIYEDAEKMRTVLPRKTVSFAEDSHLARILSCNPCRVNALHHQSIDVLGKGLARGRP